MDKNQALKLALEALDCIYSPLHVREIEKVGNAMKAIRKVLAQPEFVLNAIDCSCGRKWRVVNNTLTASEQPEQEPVAWELRAGKTDRVLIEITNNPQRAHDWKASLEEVVPLYAAPPQREWVGLTEEEKESFWKADQMTHKEWDELFAATEATLREKNGG